MTINWLKNSELTGVAKISKNNIELNKTFINHFENVSNALIGVSNEKNIIIKPLSLDEVDNPKYKDLLIVKVSPFTNFLRIGNSKFVQILEPILNLNLSNKAVKYRTTWNDEENLLTIDLNRKDLE